MTDGQHHRRLRQHKNLVLEKSKRQHYHSHVDPHTYEANKGNDSEAWTSGDGEKQKEKNAKERETMRQWQNVLLRPAAGPCAVLIAEGTRVVTDGQHDRSLRLRVAPLTARRIRVAVAHKRIVRQHGPLVLEKSRRQHYHSHVDPHTHTKQTKATILKHGPVVMEKSKKRRTQRKERR